MRNRERVQAENHAERKRLMKAFSDMMPELKFLTNGSKAKYGDEATCCICFEEYDHISRVRETPCNHLFHSKCLMEWVKAKLPNPDCPYCRESFKL